MNRTIPALFLALAAAGWSLHGQSAATNAPAVGAGSLVTPSGLALPPYLQVLSPESVAVLWQTTAPAYGWVEYGETKDPGKKQDAVVNGLNVANLLARAGIDLAINAHTHRRAFHPADTVGAPYPIAIGGGPQLSGATVMMLEADSRHLKLRMLNADGKEVFPAFEKKK